MKAELRNCPFCNGDFVMAVSIGERKENFDEAEVYCATCGASIIRNCKHFSSQKSTDEAVIKHWNTRPIEDGLQAEIEALQQELDELKEQYRWHSLEKDGLPELNQDVRLWSYTYREIRIGHFYDYEEGNETSPDIWFDDYERYECFRLDELPKKYQWRYLNAPKGGE